MSAIQLRGRKLANEIYEEIRETLGQIGVPEDTPPRIAVVSIGDNENAKAYSRALQKAANRSGFNYRNVHLPANSSKTYVIATLRELNEDPQVAGILLLTPLPAHLRAAQLHWHVNPAKDIDGTHPENLGRLMSDSSEALVPATPAAGMALLDQVGLDLRGMESVVIGRSLTVGKPLGLLLLQRHCTITLAHSRTERLSVVASRADLLCVAVGQPHLVTGDFVKHGATVLDFGTTYTAEGLKGDCDSESVSAKASAYTPVPGGIGPLTNAILMRNALQALKNR